MSEVPPTITPDTVESPIEWAFLVAFCACSHEMGCGDLIHLSTKEEIKADLAREPDVGRVYIIPQAKISTFRVDFLLEMHAADIVSRLVIECDGHNWHDRTKEQAARDRSRDRILLYAGVPVIRYTGSEIFRCAAQCADEAWHILRSAWFHDFRRGGHL